MASRPIFARLIDENMMGKVIPGILGQGLEFKDMKPSSEKEEQDLQKILERPEVKGALPVDPSGEIEIQEKPVCLLLSHLYGFMDEYYDPADSKVQKDLEAILRAIPSYLDIMIMITMFLVN